jgi:hypothetical protein
VGGRGGSKGVGREGVSICGVVRGEVRCWEGRRGNEERRDLYFGRVDVWRAYDRVLLHVDAVEGAEGGVGGLTSDLGVNVAHDGVPYFDSPTAFEYIYPYRTTVT